MCDENNKAENRPQAGDTKRVSDIEDMRFRGAATAGFSPTLKATTGYAEPDLAKLQAEQRVKGLLSAYHETSVRAELLKRAARLLEKHPEFEEYTYLKSMGIL